MFHFLLVPLALTAIYASDLDINAYQSGNSLLALCESKSVADQAQCIGYLQATADEISFDHLIGRSPICMRHDVTGNQLRDVR